MGEPARRAVQWTEASIASLVASTFPLPTYASLMHVGNATGFANRGWLDVIVVGLWPSRGLVVYGFEIKVSRSDWRRELKAPEKAENLARYCDKFFVVAPEGIVTTTELPVGWGLYEAREGAKVLKLSKDAPQRQSDQIDRSFLAALMKRATEQTVPLADVERQVKEKLEKARAQAERDRLHRREDRDFELESARAEAARLRKMISDFEEASGVSLSGGYQGAHVGRAFVEALKWKSPEHLAKRLDGVVKEIDALKKAASDAANELRAMGPDDDRDGRADGDDTAKSAGREGR